MRQGAVEELGPAVRAADQGEVEPEAVVLPAALGHDAGPVVHGVGPASLADDLAGSSASDAAAGGSPRIVGKGNVMRRAAGIGPAAAAVGAAGALTGRLVRRGQRRRGAAAVVVGLVAGDRHRPEHVAHGREHALHPLPAEEVEQAHLLPFLAGAADEVGAVPAGQRDELVVAVDQPAVDGGDAQGDAARAEDVLVVEPPDEDQELVLGAAGGAEGAPGDGGGGPRLPAYGPAAADGVGDDGVADVAAAAHHGGRGDAPGGGAGGRGRGDESAPDGKVVGGGRARPPAGGRRRRRRSGLRHDVGRPPDGVEELGVLFVQQGLAAAEALDVVGDADQRRVLVGLERDVGFGEDVAEVVDLDRDLLRPLLLAGVAVPTPLDAVGPVLGHHGLGSGGVVRYGRWEGPLGAGGVLGPHSSCCCRRDVDVHHLGSADHGSVGHGRVDRSAHRAELVELWLLLLQRGSPSSDPSSSSTSCV
mmetsp:Transcript_4302/g.10258  ORF Transcript_4302/g.10258 Transcript_4302/m.10258 type:complete len:475 (+) Transcript_4302:238-1662(+)